MKPKYLVELTFRNTDQHDKRFKLRILPTSEKTSERWMLLLAEACNAGNELEKNYSWSGFPYGERNLPILCSEINETIDIINNWLTSTNDPLYIKEKCYPDNVFVDGKLNRDLMNRVHHYFELMQGQVWEPATRYFTHSTDEVRNSIRALNNLIHEIENWVNGELLRRSHPEAVGAVYIHSYFKSRRVELNYFDYQNFTLDRYFGDVYMHYCQAGKTHWEAFQDNDDVIFDNNISGLRFMSGEFNINFGPLRDNTFDYHRIQKIDYALWLAKKGWSIHDKVEGHGRLLVGKVDLSAFSDCMNGDQVDVEKAQLKVAQFQDLYRIRVVCNQRIIAEREFDYTWKDKKLHEIRKAILSAHYATYCNKT